MGSRLETGERRSWSGDAAAEREEGRAVMKEE
jgi:hypothetical protein